MKARQYTEGFCSIKVVGKYPSSDGRLDMSWDWGGYFKALLHLSPYIVAGMIISGIYLHLKIYKYPNHKNNPRYPEDEKGKLGPTPYIEGSSANHSADENKTYSTPKLTVIAHLRRIIAKVKSVVQPKANRTKRHVRLD